MDVVVLISLTHKLFPSTKKSGKFFLCLFPLFYLLRCDQSSTSIDDRCTLLHLRLSIWCRQSRNGPIMQWFAVLEILDYILTQPSQVSLPELKHPQTSLPVLTHPQPSLPVLTYPQVSLPVRTHPQVSLTVLTHLQPSSPVITHPQVYLKVLTHPQPSLPVLTHPQPSLPVLTHPQPSLPVLTHPQPSLPALTHPSPSSVLQNTIFFWQP